MAVEGSYTLWGGSRRQSRGIFLFDALDFAVVWVKSCNKEDDDRV